MKRKIFKTIILLAFGVAIYYFLLRSPMSNEGKIAPDFTTELINGESFTLSELRGEYVLLDFWGSWCPPCRRDNPNLARLYNEFHGKSFQDGTNFSIVTVALERNNKHWENAAKKDGFMWNHQIVQEAKIVLLSPLAQKYSVKDIPAKFLIDPKGKIIGVNQSYAEIKAYLQSKL
jgi:thiol-disulfide isomerase/thioredoxin